MKDKKTSNENSYRDRTSRQFGSRRNLLIKGIPILIAAFVVIIAFYNVLKATYLDNQFSRVQPKHWVDLDEPDTYSPENNKDSSELPYLRVAIAPVISPEKSLIKYQELVEYLANKLDRKPESFQRTTYAQTNDLVRYGRCDIAFVCTYPFVRGEMEFGMQALVVPQVAGKVTYHSLILVPEGSQVNSLLDLRDKRFASADIMSNSGWLYPATWLIKHGENPNEFFSEHILSGSHDRSVEAVVNKYVDGAAVDSLVFDQMVKEDQSILVKTRIVIQSPPFGMPPLAVPPDIDPDLKSSILSVLLNMHNDNQGRKILDDLLIDKFVVPEQQLFDSVRKEIKTLESLQ